MVAHVRFRAIEKAFEFQPIRITICDYVADLANDCGKDEHANQVAGNREYVPVRRG